MLELSTQITDKKRISDNITPKLTAEWNIKSGEPAQVLVEGKDKFEFLQKLRKKLKKQPEEKLTKIPL